MNVKIYMESFAYKYGGAEAYTANIIEFIQNRYPDSQITLITEHLKGKEKLTPEQVVNMQNEAYGTSIQTKNFSVQYFYFNNINEEKTKNSFLRYLLIIIKEIYEIKRFNFIRKSSEETDLFINVAHNIIAGSANKNICVVHFPKLHSSESGISKRIFYFKKQARKRDLAYANNYDLYLPNSNFTSGHLKQRWQIPDSKIKVFYPPVKCIGNGDKKNKVNQIFICSRICRKKKIDVILQALGSSDFLRERAHIVVAGSAVGEEESFVESLKKDFHGVEFHFDPKRDELESFYRESGIFVHAMGYGETVPDRFEHFGITTVEAMSAGCVPVVINKGGQQEIVTENCGFRWNTLDELVEKVEWLIKNPEKAEVLRKNAEERSQFFSSSKFISEFGRVISENINV